MKQHLLLVSVIISCIVLTGCHIPKEESADCTESISEMVETGAETTNIISPLPITVNLDNPGDCTMAVSLGKGDVYVDEAGVMQMKVMVYTYDLYDMVDISALKEGDTIVIRGQEVEITSLERDERGLVLNGGLDNNGYEFRTDSTTVWYESGYSDLKSYYELGKITLPMSPDMIFRDGSDLDKGEVTYYPEDFLTDDAGIVYHFVPDNTGIVIENGMIIEMYRSYMP